MEENKEGTWKGFWFFGFKGKDPCQEPKGKRTDGYQRT